MNKILVCTLSMVILSGCAHSVHQSHTSDFKNMRVGARLIESSGEQHTILGFTQDTKYVEQAYSGLMKQCAGRITGITSKFTTSLGFFSWTNKIKMSGYCIPHS